MLILLSLFSFLRCKPGAPAVTGKTESDADRQTNCNQFIEALYPICVKGKWGYINRKGETVLQPTWDEADDVTEDEAQLFTWTLVESELTHIHILEMGGTVPKVYTVTELTATSLKYKDDFGKSFSFTKVSK